jgi:hypothetical protein
MKRSPCNTLRIVIVGDGVAGHSKHLRSMNGLLRTSRSRIGQEREAEHDVSSFIAEAVRCADANVLLECNGELMEVGSVDVLRIREATPGIELVEFACPRCRTPHASLRFG